MSKLPKTPAAATLTRKQTSRAERERRLQRYVIGGTLVVAVLVIGLLGYAALDQLLLVPQQPVANVNGTVIRTAQFQTAVRYQRFQLIAQYGEAYQTYQIFGGDPQLSAYFQQQLQSILAQLSDSESLGRNVLNALIDDELIRQEAARRGLTVSEAEIDERMRQSFDFYPNGTPTPTITPTPYPTDVNPPTSTYAPQVVAAWTPTPTLTPTATLAPTDTPAPGPSATPEATGTPLPTATPYTAAGYATAVAQVEGNLAQEAKFKPTDLRRLIESQLYGEKVQAAFAAEVPAVAEEVRVRHILVADAALAAVLAEKLKAGDDFSHMAALYSLDTSNKDQGGILPWFAADGTMAAEFETAAFATAVGAMSEPVHTQFGWHVIEVLAREQRTLTPEQLNRRGQQAFSDWLAAQRTATSSDGKPLVETFDSWSKHVPTDPALTTQ